MHTCCAPEEERESGVSEREGGRKGKKYFEPLVNTFLVELMITWSQSLDPLPHRERREEDGMRVVSEISHPLN